VNEILLADGVGYTGLFADFNTTFWSGMLRIAYAMVAAAPAALAEDDVIRPRHPPLVLSSGGATRRLNKVA